MNGGVTDLLVRLTVDELDEWEAAQLRAIDALLQRLHHCYAWRGTGSSRLLLPLGLGHGLGGFDNAACSLSAVCTQTID